MPDYADIALGLLGGLGEGVKSYSQTMKANRALDAEMAAKGMKYDPSSNQYVVDAEAEAKKRKEKQLEQQLKAKLEGYDLTFKPDSMEIESYVPNKEYWQQKERIEQAKAANNPLTAINAAIKARELKQPSLTPGQEALDKEFAKQIVEWDQMGGFAGAEKNFARLTGALQKMSSGQVTTGKGRGLIPKSIRDAAMPELSAVQEDIESAVQNTMRATLGPGFTEKEGVAILNRAFNPNLSTEENVRRAQLVMNELRSIAQAKNEASKYFKKFGTLQGFSGPTDFYLPVERIDEVLEKDRAFQASGAESKGLLQPSVGAENEIKEWQGKRYERVGDEWVEVK